MLLVVTWNHREKTGACVKSLRKANLLESWQACIDAFHAQVTEQQTTDSPTQPQHSASMPKRFYLTVSLSSRECEMADEGVPTTISNAGGLLKISYSEAGGVCG